jgi:hypothetical protein
MQGQLPQEAVDLLKQAAQTPITPADPLARVKAIEKATQRIQSRYPKLFNERPENENQT